MFKTKEEILETVISALPVPFITDIDMSEQEAIRFSWSKIRYRVTVNNSVEKVTTNGLLSGTNSTKLIQALLKEAKLLKDAK